MNFFGQFKSGKIISISDSSYSNYSMNAKSPLRFFLLKGLNEKKCALEGRLQAEMETKSIVINFNMRFKRVNR